MLGRHLLAFLLSLSWISLSYWVEPIWESGAPQWLAVTVLIWALILYVERAVWLPILVSTTGRWSWIRANSTVILILVVSIFIGLGVTYLIIESTNTTVSRSVPTEPIRRGSWYEWLYGNPDFNAGFSEGSVSGPLDQYGKGLKVTYYSSYLENVYLEVLNDTGDSLSAEARVIDEGEPGDLFVVSTLPRRNFTLGWMSVGSRKVLLLATQDRMSSSLQGPIISFRPELRFWEVGLLSNFTEVGGKKWSETNGPSRRSEPTSDYLILEIKIKAGEDTLFVSEYTMRPIARGISVTSSSDSIQGG